MKTTTKKLAHHEMLAPQKQASRKATTPCFFCLFVDNNTVFVGFSQELKNFRKKEQRPHQIFDAAAVPYTKERKNNKKN